VLGFSSYRAPLGLGQYGVEVIAAAAGREAKEIRWHDARNKVQTPLPSDVVAVLVNRSSTFSRHWFAVRAVGTRWFNLDSKFHEAELLGDEEAAVAVLNKFLSQGDQIIYLVTSKS